MRPDLLTMIDRVAQLREEVASGAPHEAVLAKIEDGLSEGYAWALSGDAWSIRTEQRLHALVNDARAPVRGPDRRVLAREHTVCQRELIALRRELAGLRRERDRLFADLPAPSR
ncbi:MAG: hypothetical protein M3401_17040 [Actinomycetota bacterium]|nr:hypothetical protein [Actinomycetota bacterium]